MHEKTYTLDTFHLALKEDIREFGAELEKELKIRRTLLTHN